MYSNAISTKLKTLYVMKYFAESTSEDNPATSKDIIAHLNQLGFRTERKAVYADIDVLKKFGMNIVKTGKGFYYKAG